MPPCFSQQRAVIAGRQIAVIAAQINYPNTGGSFALRNRLAGIAMFEILFKSNDLLAGIIGGSQSARLSITIKVSDIQAQLSG